MPEITNGQESQTTSPSSPIDEPTTTVLDAALPAEFDPLQHKLLPDFMYCRGCGAMHLGNDMHFRASVSGSAHGSAWISGSVVDTETNEDDTQYDDYEYYCDHCDTEVTGDVLKTTEYIEMLQSISSQNNLNIRAEIDQVRQTINGTSNPPVLFEMCDNQGHFIRYIKRDSNNSYVSTELLHPKLLSYAKQLSEDDEDYMFNYLDPVYEECANAYNAILRAIAERNAAIAQAQHAVEATAFADAAMTAAPNRSRVRMVEFNPFEFYNGEFPQEDASDRDPMNSNIYQPTHHQRWRDTDLNYICTCEHCSYSFECDRELDVVTCPKCKKDTRNADN